MEGFRKLFFSAVFCGVFVAPAWADLPFEPIDISMDIPGVPDINQNTNSTEESGDEDGESGDADENEEDITERSVAESMLATIESLGWCRDNGTNVIEEDSTDAEKQEICRQVIELVPAMQTELDENTQALEENYQNMKDKETSFENRMLGAAGIGTVGIGGMMAASALAEQSADAAAERDMQAYLSTFQCKIGDKGGKSYSGGTMGIELGGANQLINLYQEYAKLAGDLKERKSALGLESGIESEVLIDKASSGLYDDVGHGIGSGAYASIARAIQNPDGADAQKWNEMKEKTSKNLKIGAGVAIGGAIATAVANYAINHDNKNKSDELLAQRQEIKNKFNTLGQKIIDLCNQTIREHKENAKLLTSEQLKNPFWQQYKQDAEDAQPITDLIEIRDSKFCE